MSCKTYKIGLFFDGTGNNAEFDKSNGRDQQSNIAKLYTLYKTGKFECEQRNCKVKADKLYERGIGTYDTQEEYDAHPIERKYDKGGGGGGAARINDAINQVTQLLDKHERSTSDPEKFQTRLIDVFGFSRGAALARDFVNTFIKNYIKEEPIYKDVRFNFIGIYDTVGSFGEPGNDVDMKSLYPDLFSEADIGLNGNMQNYMIEEHDSDKIRTHRELFKKREQAQARAEQLNNYDGMKVVVAPYYPPNPYGTVVASGYEVIATIKESDAYDAYNFNLCSQSAKKIIHMTAHDEVRKNFPLTDIHGTGGMECAMLGVHSDVGGGYPPQKIERHKFEYRGHFMGVEKAAQAHAKRLSKEIQGLWSLEHATCSRSGRGYYILNRKVLNDLSNVTLNLMYEEASKHNVHFKPLPQNEDHAILPDIEAYYNYAKEHIDNAYTYAHTQDGEKIEETLRHHSSVDPARKSTHYIGNNTLKDAILNDSADGGGNDARYVNAYGKQIDARENPQQAQRVKRAIFSNNPKKAVKPA